MKYTQFSSFRPEYQYGITVDRMLDFHEARIWLQSNYGWCGIVAEPTYDNEHWAYHIEYTNYLIYLRGDAELAWWRLRWG